MTKEEVDEKYKNEKVTFSSYYKYCFTFTGKCGDGNSILCEIFDEIYKLSVEADKLIPFVGCDIWDYVEIMDKDGNKIFSYKA